MPITMWITVQHKYDMRNFINLIEEYDDASYDREKHVENLIRYAFNKIGIEISYNNYAVNYEDSTREAMVKIEDSEISLDRLVKVTETGLAEGEASAYNIGHYGDDLVITFIVAPAIDQAEIPE